MSPTQSSPSLSRERMRRRVESDIARKRVLTPAVDSTFRTMRTSSRRCAAVAMVESTSTA